MSDVRKFSLVKPTTQTPFHIDFEWWKKHDNNWHVFLQSCLCPEHQTAYTNANGEEQIDWVDPNTAEVFQVDGLQQTLMSHCSKQPDFLTVNSSLVDAVFRVLVSNGNTAMTPEQLAEKTGRSADTILRTLSGPQVYKGIRPNHQG